MSPLSHPGDTVINNQTGEKMRGKKTTIIILAVKTKEKDQ